MLELVETRRASEGSMFTINTRNHQASSGIGSLLFTAL